MSPGIVVSPLKVEVDSGAGFAEVPYVEWDIDWEEVLGGTGRSTFKAQDRTNSWNPQPHWHVKVSARSTGWIFFRGVIVRPRGVLGLLHPWTVWGIDCADYNDERSQRKVGAPDGTNWIDQDGTGDFINVDPSAQSSGTDKATVQALFDHYIRVHGEAFETSTYVGQYVSIDPPIYWDFSDLQAALEDTASEAIVNLQFWSDPDMYFHWWAVPAWQDLLQEAIVGAPTLPLMFPQADLGSNGNGFAPRNISDVPGTPNAIGCRNFTFDYDGGSMPEQVYIRGGTGYSYGNGDDGGSQQPVGAPPSGPPAPGQYKVTFNEDTLVYSRETGTGFIHLPGVTIPAGTVVYGNPQVVPLDPVRLTGGHFYNMKTGPLKGYEVSFWTNKLGYGDITVELAGAPDFCNPPTSGPATAPVRGTGGSGWTNEVTQDPNKRQAYFDAPISTDRAKRDAIGNQVIYRGSRPTLRGSLTIGGYIQDPAFPDDPEMRILAEGSDIDGYRVGQLMKITDERLEAYGLNNTYFVIQRVHGTVIPTTDARQYDIDWGDGPVSRYSAQKRDRAETPPPVTTIGVLVTEEDVAPAPNQTQTITGQLINAAGLPWAIPDKTVNWQLQVLDSLGNVCDSEGTLDPPTSMTDRNGTARTKLTSGPRRGLTYFVYATVPVS